MAMRPFPGFPPELLAEMARAAFRPPNAGGAPGLQAPQQGGGMGLNQGLAGLGWGLANWTPPQGPEANVSGFAVGGGPQGPSGGALAPDSGGLGAWLRGLF